MMKKLLIVSISFFFLGCGSVKSTVNSGIIFLSDFGAVANDELDDSDSFQKAFNMMIARPGAYVLQLPDGILNVKRRVMVRNASLNVEIRGGQNTKIQVSQQGFGFFESKSEKVKLLHPAKRNNTQVDIGYRKKIKAGDLIHLQSSSNYETGWKYKENDIQRIADVQDEKIFFQDSLIFNYDPKIEDVSVTHYSKSYMSFKDIDFELESEKGTQSPIRSEIIVIRGMSISIDSVGLYYRGPVKLFHIGISLVACEGVKFSNIYMEGFVYGVLMNYSRNVTAFNTTAVSCRHAYTPSQACFNIFIENLRGIKCHSVIDSHVSFNVHYKDVLDTLATRTPNCRALGTFIENTTIYVGENVYQDYAYWSVQTLTEEYSHLYGEFDTRFRNVTWVAPTPSSFNGLNSFSCRNLIVEGCTTHSVSYYGKQAILKSVSISNSKIGVVRIDAQKTQISNSIMDGKLFPKSNFVFRFTGGGKTTIDRVQIQGYNPEQTYLFDNFYNLGQSNALDLNQVTVGPLRGWTNKFTYPGKIYNNVTLNSVQFHPFKENVPVELPSIKKLSSDIKN